VSDVHPVVAYTRGVMDGSIPACQLVRQCVERHLRDLETASERGLHFDRASAEHALRFFGFLRHTKGEWRGQVFQLSPWQAFIVWALFGWKRADGTRRFRLAYIEVPRKNGKSEFAAGLGLLLLVADGEPAAEIYSAATKRDQAKIVWGAAQQMVELSPELDGLISHWKSSLTLAIEKWGSKFQPLGADADTMDGLNIHGAIVDELHAHKTSDVVDVLETATGARRQPLQLEITTAGFDRESICWEHHEYTRQVCEGLIQDDTWFGFIASIDDGDDWKDPATWAKANPNYGVSVKPDDLARKSEKAQHMPVAQNAFRRLHLDEWTQQNDRFIDIDLWDANAGEFTEDDLLAQPCYGGLDLSSVADLTAWVMMFPQADDSLRVLARFWCPEERLIDDQNRYKDQYQA
jgi:phage terminase large subunit-like protein